MAKVTLNKPAQGERVRPMLKKRGRREPDFDTMFEDEGDPLEAVEYDANDLETSAEREMSEVVKQIKADKQARYERFRIARDPHYYVVLCFQSHEQRDEFVEKTGWATVGERFVNGLDVARKLGVDVKPIPLEPLPQRGKPHLYRPEEVL